eukprot:Clim_evm12s100 gene=Clim_evmTU12s100
MNFKIAVLAAAAAVASADPSENSAPLRIPKIMRDAIAQNTEAFVSEEARQEFLAGEGDEASATNFYFGEQATFGQYGCTEADKVDWMNVFCGVYTLEGDNQELILYNEFKIGGYLKMGGTTLEVPYMKTRDNYYEWNFKETMIPLDWVTDFTFAIGEEGKALTFDETKEWNESLFAYQFPGKWIFEKQRIFWYRYGSKTLRGHETEEDQPQLWCAFMAQPKCNKV